MRCLTLHQPWASLIACGAKSIETRSWATKYRGPLAIHASSRGYVHSGLPFDLLYNALEGTPMASLSERGRGIVYSAFPRGQIIAICHLIDVRPIRFSGIGAGGPWLDPDMLSAQERAVGDYTPGRYAWELCNVVPIPEPIPAKGARMLRNCDLPELMTFAKQWEESYANAIS